MQITRIGIDLEKNALQIHVVDSHPNLTRYSVEGLTLFARCGLGSLVAISMAELLA